MPRTPMVLLIAGMATVSLSVGLAWSQTGSDGKCTKPSKSKADKSSANGFNARPFGNDPGILNGTSSSRSRRGGNKVDFSNSSETPNQVTIEERDGYRYIFANGIPDHAHGDFPNRGNPNSILAQRFAFRVPLEPEWREEPLPLGHHPFGVALNGVPFDPGTAEFWNGDRQSGWNYEAMSGRIDLGLDHNHAHVQPNGAYHYHGTPKDLIQVLLKQSRRQSASNSNGKTPMVLLGYAADGYPIYNAVGHLDPQNQQSRRKMLRSSYRLKKGTRPGGPRGKYDGTFTEDYEFVSGSGDLDECNGHFGVTPDSEGPTYYYCITESFPHIPRFHHGEPDESFLRRRHFDPGPRPRVP